MFKRITAICIVFCSIILQFLPSVVSATTDSEKGSDKYDVIETENFSENTKTVSVFSVLDPFINSHDTFIADLGDVYEITSTEVTQYNSSVSGLDSYELYLSSDGINYMYIGEVEASDRINYTLNIIEYRVRQKIYARYAKFVIHKSQDKSSVMIKKIEVFGKKGISEIRIDGEAEYSYYTQNPYCTGDDIRMQDKNCTKLMDDDITNLIATNEKWATVVIDLKKPYQIGNVDLYTLADENRFMEGCEIRYSLDGKKFFTYTYYLNHNKKTGEIVKSSFSGMPGRNARFLKIIMQTSFGGIAVSEIDINGYPIQYTNSNMDLNVPFRVEMKNYLLAYIDWSTFDSKNASKVALYIEKRAFKDTKELTPVAVYSSEDDAFVYKYATKTNLEPETTYYFAMTAFDISGNEYTEVQPIKIKTQKVLGENVSDVFNIVNHPNYGGGTTKKFGSYTESMKKEAVRLMDEMGASNKNRLWEVSGANTKMYTDIGVSTLLFSSAEISKSYGNYAYGVSNEPDLSKADVNAYLTGMKSRYRSLKYNDRRNILSCPALGGTEIGSLNWLEDLYKAGNGIETKLNFDVMDVHFYCKSGDEQIAGLPIAVPEILFSKIANIREVMKKYNDGDKPIISTETGFHTAPVNGYMPNVDYETQRDYIVRMYMIMISQGIREVWYYNFHDDGYDDNVSEHHWGLIDYFGVPKPSYYGYYNMYQQLRNAEYVGPVSGLSNPYYGYEFYDQMKNKIITVIWSADGQSKNMAFETLSGHNENIEIIGCNGSFKVLDTTDGVGNTEIGRGPIYIYSDNGIKANSIDVAFAVKRASMDTLRGKPVTFTLLRKNLGMGLSGYITAENLPNGWSISNDTKFDESQQSIDVTVNVPDMADEKKENFVLKILMSNNTFSEINVNVDVKPPIHITITPEPIEFGNWDKWRLAAYCTNVVDVPVSGKLSVLGSEGINITTMEAQEISQLKPGQTVKLYFDVETPPTEPGAIGTFMLEVNGKNTSFDRNLNFSACINDGITPVIDGTISSGEWDNCHIVTQDSMRHSKWKGMTDLSFKIYRKWDESYFYLAVDVTDDIFSQPYKGSEIWQGDTVQFTIDPARKDGVGISTADYFELGISRNDENEMLTWVWSADLVIKKERAIGSYHGAVNRTDDGHTIYEIAIPWGFLTEKGVVNEGDCMGFAVAVNDNDDGTGRKGYLTYMGGIANAKDANKFEDMVLIKK